MIQEAQKNVSDDEYLISSPTGYGTDGLGLAPVV